ncbi:MAG: hypothetical protein RIM80_15540 [Alphaproteobacteria bacterium]
MRSALARLAIVVLAAAPLMAAGGGDGGPDPSETRTAYQVDIRDREGRGSSIDRIVVVGDGQVRVAKARKGMARRNQSRIDYSAAPLVGKLSEHRYDKEDFEDAQRVGVARVDGHDLILVLDTDASVALDGVAKLAVLNGDVAYETRRPPGGAEAAEASAWAAKGREVGKVYRYGDDALLALVRPFVVTDSGLW